MIVTLTQIMKLLPVLVLGTMVCVVILSISYDRNQFRHAILTVIGLIVSIVIVSTMWGAQNNQNIDNMIYIDNVAILCTMLVLISTVATTVLAYRWLLSYPGNCDEFYLLLLISAIGGVLLVVSNHLVVLFLGMELISLPFFGLIGYSCIQKFSVEASVKYIILSGVSSSFLLFGIALVYMTTGYLSFFEINNVLSLDCESSIALCHKYPVVLGTGLSMIMVGFGFKLSCVPFHIWTPDVYQGTSSSVSMYLTTGMKIAIVSVLIRFFMILPDQYNKIFYVCLSGIACCSILCGNLLALGQDNIKRVLAYSSIAHMGYLLIGIIALRLNAMALEAIGIYLIGYLFSNIGMFGVISILSVACVNGDADSLRLYRGLFWYKPILSIVLTVVLLSLASVPLTFGFIGKFYLLMLGINSKLWFLSVFFVVGSIISLFYYLRIMICLYLRPFSSSDNDDDNNKLSLCVDIPEITNWMTTPSGIMVLVVSALILCLGLYPMPIIHMVRFVCSI